MNTYINILRHRPQERKDTKHMMNRIELKQEAKGVVRTAAVSAYLFALLYLALTELLQGASVYVNGDVALYMQTY